MHRVMFQCYGLREMAEGWLSSGLLHKGIGTK